MEFTILLVAIVLINVAMYRRYISGVQMSGIAILFAMTVAAMAEANQFPVELVPVVPLGLIASGVILAVLGVLEELSGFSLLEI